MPQSHKNKTTAYVSKKPDDKGFIHYSTEENAVWHDLITRQIPLLPHRACHPWIDALNEMNFPIDRVPQLDEVSKVLMQHTGWSVAPVPALIGFTEFFQLLANKQFPVATFIRSREDFDYIQEPDIFHEVFGHTPPLTDHRFGLVHTDDGIRAYGSGIMSSPGELVYAVESEKPQRKAFDPVDILRTPYRIDIFQPIYFVLESFDQLFELAQSDLLGHIREARRQGMHEPMFPPKEAA
jgi:phenylalanine-4-hydroxylase